MIPALALAIALAIVLAVVWSRYTRLKRERYIRDYVMPRGLYERMKKRRPQLEIRDGMLVARGLRKFFLARLNARGRRVAMPSQAAAELWQEFSLYTRTYDHFCRHAFGHPLPPTPAVALGDDRGDNEGLRRVWWHACKEENIDPQRPVRLPLLFALDAKLGIDGGFRYSTDVRPRREGDALIEGEFLSPLDFGDPEIDGRLDGFGDDGTTGGDGGDGGGDGGGGGD